MTVGDRVAADPEGFCDLLLTVLIGIATGRDQDETRLLLERVTRVAEPRVTDQPQDYP